MPKQDIHNIESWESRKVTRRGQDIHYLVYGEGPLLICAHGGLATGPMQFLNPLCPQLGAFSDGFQIALPDSLGHGQSSKPADVSMYALKERAADLVAVADDLGADKAWYMGYSMGGWTVAGLAKYFPDRAAGLVIGGWDVEKGMYTSAPTLGLEEITFDDLIRLAQENEDLPPEFVPQFSAEEEAAMRPAINALNTLDDQDKAVAEVEAPVLFWVGRDDPYHGPMLDYTSRNQIPLLTTPGDHQIAGMAHGNMAMSMIRGFIEQYNG